MTSKYESTFCHQTTKAKSDFSDHDAATPLFIEIADIHIAIPYAREKMAAMFLAWGLLKPELNLCEHYACLLPMQEQW